LAYAGESADVLIHPPSSPDRSLAANSA
jgi:hypothetical protein